MSARSEILSLNCIAFLCVLVLASACSRDQKTTETDPAAETLSFENLSSETAFVGDDACFDCHETEYRGYKEHGMANSLYPLTSDTWIENIDGSTVTDSSSGYHYTVFDEGGRYYQEEFRVDENGEKVYSQAREMQVVIGSGISARSYLVSDNGWLYQLPLSWYVQREKWDFSPGYQVANKRFDRKILPRCLTCHDAYPDEVPYTDGKYSEIPYGISCERCHGPGGEHVEQRLAFPEADSIDYSIVNPEHLILERRLDICQQCHLNPTVSVLRKGRTAYDFRPSQDLSEYLSLFEVESPETHNEIGLTSHVGRMKTSACYTGSLALGNPLECTTCHDPHSGFRNEGPEYFNATCRMCHETDAVQERLSNSRSVSDHDARSNCISCHMPKADIAKVAHSNFTDHWIRVVDPDEKPDAVPVSDPPELLPIFDADRGNGVYEGMAYIVYGTQYRDSTYLTHGISLLTASLEPESDFGEAHFLLGLAHTQIGQAEQSIPLLERAVTLDSGVPERLNALAQAYESTGRDPVRIERLYQRALAIQPARSDIRLNYGRFLEARGRVEEAVLEYQEAILEEPGFASAHYNLGTAQLRQGRVDEAESSLRDALNLDPLDPEALGNLGILYARSDRPEEALSIFERAANANPDNPVALGNLGTHYVQLDRLSDAIPLLKRAIELAPEYVDGRVNLALAYFRNDEFENSRSQAEAALRLAPDHPLARQILDAL